MQTHTSGTASPGEFPVKLNPGGGDPFVTITIANTTHFCETLDDFDRGIRAFAEGKQLWLEARRLLAAQPCLEWVVETGTGNAFYCELKAAHEGDHHFVPGAENSDPWCPAFTEMDGETFYCDREPGHPGSHHAPGPDEGSEVAWSDEADEPEESLDQHAYRFMEATTEALREFAGNPDGAA